MLAHVSLEYIKEYEDAQVGNGHRKRRRLNALRFSIALKTGEARIRYFDDALI